MIGQGLVVAMDEQKCIHQSNKVFCQKQSVCPHEKLIGFTKLCRLALEKMKPMIDTIQKRTPKTGK